MTKYEYRIKGNYLYFTYYRVYEKIQDVLRVLAKNLGMSIVKIDTNLMPTPHTSVIFKADKETSEKFIEVLASKKLPLSIQNNSLELEETKSIEDEESNFPHIMPNKGATFHNSLLLGDNSSPEYSSIADIEKAFDNGVFLCMPVHEVASEVLTKYTKKALKDVECELVTDHHVSLLCSKDKFKHYDEVKGKQSFNLQRVYHGEVVAIKQFGEYFGLEIISAEIDSRREYWNNLYSSIYEDALAYPLHVSLAKIPESNYKAYQKRIEKIFKPLMNKIVTFTIETIDPLKD